MHPKKVKTFAQNTHAYLKFPNCLLYNESAPTLYGGAKIAHVYDGELTQKYSKPMLTLILNAVLKESILVWCILKLNWS